MAGSFWRSCSCSLRSAVGYYMMLCVAYAMDASYEYSTCIMCETKNDFHGPTEREMMQMHLCALKWMVSENERTARREGITAGSQEPRYHSILWYKSIRFQYIILVFCFFRAKILCSKWIWYYDVCCAGVHVSEGPEVNCRMWKRLSESVLCCKLYFSGMGVLERELLNGGGC